MKINNRDLPAEAARPCLEGETIHENILLLAKSLVNDINQVGIVPIVLEHLSDNLYNEMQKCMSVSKLPQ
jgi:hypothetical protein